MSDHRCSRAALSDFIYNSLLEECVWKIAVLEHKRARNYREFLAQQEASREPHASEKKVLSEKHNNDTNVDCPVCARDISATRFAPHLAKCLKLGGRGQATKKIVASDLSKIANIPGSENQSSPNLALKSVKKLAGQANPRKRGRPKKNGSITGDSELGLSAIPRPKKIVLTPAESEAILSNAITNATQRLNQKQQLGTQALTTSTNPSVRASNSPHPLSQSHVATGTSVSVEPGAPPPPKVKLKRKKKSALHEARSRHSSQASSSSDSEDETIAQEEDEEEEEYEDHEPDGESDERLGPNQEAGGSQMDTNDPFGGHDGRGRLDSFVGDDSCTTGVTLPIPPSDPVEITTLPRPASTCTSSKTGTAPIRAQILETRPPLKRKSSSQADSTDEDSD